MLFRKGLELAVCIGLLAGCSSSQPGIGAKDVSSGLSREEAEAEWISRVGNVWAGFHAPKEGAEAEYWLSSADVSEILLNNKYYSKVNRLDFYAASWSRDVCGNNSYDELIAENIGTDSEGVRHAESIGYVNIGGSSDSEKVLGDDAMFVMVSMSVFKINQGVARDDVGRNIFSALQNMISSQSSTGRCKFRMRSQFKDGTQWFGLEKQVIRNWPMEKDFICSKKPCLKTRTSSEYETFLSDEGASSDGGFYLLQANLKGRPFMRSVTFVPRPEESALLLLEVITERNNFSQEQISGEMAEQHAKTSAELLLAWKKKSGNLIQLDELTSLYAKARPVSESATAEIDSIWRSLSGGL
jgi:hypothetical protein